ncbi:MAG: GAF domain-containing protein [Elusimicrobia bacterium]|nr:GAF domain-containing protein [Elusimicrobiota bacterium]
MTHRSPRLRAAGRSAGTAAVQERRLAQAEMLLAIPRKLAAIDSLDEILETLVKMTTMELGAERGSLFLNDGQAGELFSIVAQGTSRRRIRIANTTGIAGSVFHAGTGAIVHNVYKDGRFNREIDQQTGFKTRCMICAPIISVKGETMGVAQVLNKRKGRFTLEDLRLLEAMTTQAAVALHGAQYVEKMRLSREKELEFLDVVADVTSEIDLGTLLRKVMREATRMLSAERSTLFLNDEKTGELWSLVGEGIGATQIRFPNHLGIGGAVFTTAKSVNIPHAYADMRFNPSFDKKTGFFTRSILCVPVINKGGKIIGVTQVLNKHGGPFSGEDESRLRAFTAQIAIALENAKLFADVQNMKNYNESMLQSMSNGVVTLDEEGKVVTCNAAGLRILKAEPSGIVGRPVDAYFSNGASWIVDKVRRVGETQQADVTMDAELCLDHTKVSANVTVLPLVSAAAKKLGTMIIIDDISGEKRMKSTMARYMDPTLADQLLAGGEDLLGGKSTVATVLFSDIRSFTTISEELGPQITVGLLNKYFTLMVECIQAEGGMLDKFIGDAIMAGFGIPIAHPDNEDRAIRCAVSMLAALRVWNSQRTEVGRRPIEIGIGLNTDTVVSGNIGSPKRMDYTMIGDGVNLAARLETACKQYGTRILISENTYKRLKGTYRIRDIDDVVVKGKTKPVKIYEVLDHHSDESFPNMMEALGFFREGRKAYAAGRWDDAAKAFKEALRLNPDDRPARLYVDRCGALKSRPPEGSWTGVTVLSEK